MRASRAVFVATLVTALVAVSAAEGGANFKGNVCGLVSTKAVRAISGVSSKCTEAKPSNGPGSTIYVGNWSPKTPGSSRLQVTVALYADTGALSLAKNNLSQGLPGTPKKVAGIGGSAYEATGHSSTGIHLNVGKYIAYVTLTTVGRQSQSTAPLEALAKAVAAGL